MAAFTVHDTVSIVVNGTEYTGQIIGDVGGGGVVVQTDHGTHTVHRSKLLRPRGPFFDVRGQVLTTSAVHPDEVGEIVAVGKSASGRPFYKVKFADQASDWFSEDQVFIETPPPGAKFAS